MPDLALAEIYDGTTGRLLASECLECGMRHFPPIDGCPDCSWPAARRAPLSPSGRVRSFTVVRLKFPGFPQDYPLVEVVFPEGVVVMGQLVGVSDPDEIEIGMTVTVEIGPVRTDQDGRPADGYRFRPGGQT